MKIVGGSEVKRTQDTKTRTGREQGQAFNPNTTNKNERKRRKKAR
jgi:hypothetical protein